jgi:hypothetical protein
MLLLIPMLSVLLSMLLVVFLIASSIASLMMADPYYLFADICCVCSLVQNLSSLATSSIREFHTSSVLAPYKFVLKLVPEQDWIISIYAWIFLCMLLGTELDKFSYKLLSSSMQALYKLHTSFIFKLVSKLSKIKLVREL